MGFKWTSTRWLGIYAIACLGTSENLSEGHLGGLELELGVRLIINYLAACGDSVGRGTALQAGRSRVRVPVESLGFFINIILS